MTLPSSLRRASAPGKLLIAGEYAVLEGHPALVTATSRRAHAQLSSVDDDGLWLQLQDGPRCHVVRGHEGLTLAPPAEEGALLLALLQAMDDDNLPLPSGLLEVDTAGFYLGAEKLGLGSSAAVCASVAALLTGAEGRSGAAEYHALADAAHTRFSGLEGKGSGVDVAASCYGGTFRFTRTPAGVALTPWQLCPAGLELIVCYAGSSTSTRHFLRELGVYKTHARRRYDEAIEGIAASTAELLEAADPLASPASFLSSLERCRDRMQELGDLAGIDIVSRPHRQIAVIAAAHGGAAKPSGAGGGDVAICFVPSEEALRCRARLNDEGFPVVEPLAANAPGARREQGAP